jgi:hypothetical protein
VDGKVAQERATLVDREVKAKVFDSDILGI